MQGDVETTAVGRLTIILGWAFTALSLLSMICYIWSKRIMRLVNGLDDILIYLSFLLSLALMSLTTWAVIVEGQGRDQSAESRSQIELVAKSLLINEFLWSTVNTCLRIAAILFIRRIFLIKMLTTILLVITAAYFIAVVSVSLVICQPIRAGWDPAVMGRCGNEIVAYLCLEVTSLVLDLAIIIAPFPILIGLHMPLRKRMAFCALFSVGSVALIIAALRIAALNRVTSNDFSYDRGYLGLLSILGPLITIVCCCATSLPAIFKYCQQKWSTNRNCLLSKDISRTISTHRSETEFAVVNINFQRHESLYTPGTPLDTKNDFTTRGEEGTGSTIQLEHCMSEVESVFV